MIKAVLFDLGNTLIEYPTPDELYKNCMLHEKELSAQGVTEATLVRMQEILKEMRRNGMDSHHEATVAEALSQAYAERGRRIPSESREILTKARDIYYYGFGKHTSLVLGAHKLLNFLRSRKMKLGIVSNTPFPGEFFKMEMERYMLAKYFHAFVWSSEFGLRKPNPFIFISALKKLDVRPDEAVFVGDKMDRDVEGALGVGMKAVWFDRNGKPGDRTLIPPNGPNTFRILSLPDMISLDLLK